LIIAGSLMIIVALSIDFRSRKSLEVQ